jgi:hypothetical protein
LRALVWLFPDEKPFVDIERVPGLLFVHLKIFLQQVDDSIVVAGEQSAPFKKKEVI